MEEAGLRVTKRVGVQSGPEDREELPGASGPSVKDGRRS